MSYFRTLEIKLLDLVFFAMTICPLHKRLDFRQESRMTTHSVFHLTHLRTCAQSRDTGGDITEVRDHLTKRMILHTIIFLKLNNMFIGYHRGIYLLENARLSLREEF